MSDSFPFATYLSPVCRYRFTKFDRRGSLDGEFLDVSDPPPHFIGTTDVIICSDVLEHVSPPVQRAFDGLFSMLRPNGTLIFTVPYSLTETIEHFPELYDWTIEEKNGEPVLKNRTRSGDFQEFDELVFHGGGEAVLEMRLFGLVSIREHLRASGFEEIMVMEDDVPEYGIRLEPWSRPITARRPAST